MKHTLHIISGIALGLLTRGATFAQKPIQLLEPLPGGVKEIAIKGQGGALEALNA